MVKPCLEYIASRTARGLLEINMCLIGTECRADSDTVDTLGKGHVGLFWFPCP